MCVCVCVLWLCLWKKGEELKMTIKDVTNKMRHKAIPHNFYTYHFLAGCCLNWTQIEKWPSRGEKERKKWNAIWNDMQLWQRQQHLKSAENANVNKMYLLYICEHSYRFSYLWCVRQCSFANDYRIRWI